MTAQVLASELSILIQESKRKNAEIRSAAEKSLADLKALPNTSESQLAADLIRRPNFVRPFLLSCASRNPKYAGTAISSLQRLVVLHGLSPETVKDVLDVLRDCTSLGLEIQLKILQALPSLVQNYAEQLTGPLLATTLHICFLLRGSKMAVVSNTAAATLQQLAVSVLGKVSREDDYPAAPVFVAEVQIDDGTTSVQSAALDAYQLLNDLCLLTEGHKPQFLHPTSVSSNFGLELIESMLSNHTDVVASHPEQVHVIRTKLMPYIIRILSERVVFPTTVRVMRLLPIIFGTMLSVLATECEMVLGLLNHILDPEAATLWKRILCMEVFRGLHSEPALFRSIFAHFDQQKGKRDIVRDHLAILVRLAAEKPSLIGLGQQSSVPVTTTESYDESDEQAALQAEGIAGTIGAAMTLRSSSAPGISMKWSNMKVSCIDQLDKTEAPTIPPAYLYSLTLTCINSFSEGLARFLLPFSIPSDVRPKRKPLQVEEDDKEKIDEAVNDDQFHGTPSPLSKPQSSSTANLPVNPLVLVNHVLYPQIQTSADMIESCWPALLAAYSTFFHAALDTEYYHSLVRSFQKFSQVAGLLRLKTPRDAFLTTLGKNAVPPAVVSAYSAATLASRSGEKRITNRQSSAEQFGEGSLPTASSMSSEKARRSIELSVISLNTRNLLCLRALLNLGIALGPILENAWFIILETLQQADSVITHLSLQRHNIQGGQSTPTASRDHGLSGDIGAEVNAVKLAAKRLLDSCGDLPDEAFLDVLTSFKRLLKGLAIVEENEPDGPAVSSPSITSHQRRTSVSGMVNGVSQDVRSNEFVVENIEQLIEQNSARLLRRPTDHSGWDVVVDSLIGILSAWDFEKVLRLKTASCLSDLVGLTASSDIPGDDRDYIRYQGLAALARMVESLYRINVDDVKSSKVCDLEIHWLTLEALRASLERYGYSLNSGWEYVFQIMTSVFNECAGTDGRRQPKDLNAIERATTVSSRSTKLVRSSFGSLQLICSDFLSSVPAACLRRLLAAVHMFCVQRDEFNIALTSTTLYWNVSHHLWQGQDSLPLSQCDPSLLSRSFTKAESQDDVQIRAAASMWLRLLFLLTASTVDQRLEVRHSALHTIFRCLDGSGERLDSDAWMVCLRLVVIRAFRMNEEMYKSSVINDPVDHENDHSGWNETAVIILDNVASTLDRYLQVIAKHNEFSSLWSDLGSHFVQLLCRSSLVLSAALYAALNKVLVRAREENLAFSPYARLVWKLWQDGNPAGHANLTPTSKADNQTALLAYLDCCIAIYQILHNDLSLQEVEVILHELSICASSSTPTSYSGDIDSMTPLQVEILESIRMIHSKSSGTTSSLVRSLASFVTMAFDRHNESGGGPTLIALSKAAMVLLRDLLVQHIDEEEICYSGALALSIRSLERPIRLKYRWHMEGKEPPPWKLATLISVDILEAAVPASQAFQVRESDVFPVWQNLINITDAIISRDIPPKVNASKVWLDEVFDIAVFKRLSSLLIPTLGLGMVSDQLRRSFSESLFRNSIIHEPHPDDLPQPNRDLLECLRSDHIGRVQDLPPSLRSKMSYEILDTFFDLVARHDGSEKRVKLAQAAAPYLILRVGMVLKAYNLDQPLRGCMPQPRSQKMEMLYILNRVVSLDSEPKAIADAPGVVPEHKKHLFRIYRLVTIALGVSRQNEEMQNALIRIIEALAIDFNI